MSLPRADAQPAILVTRPAPDDRNLVRELTDLGFARVFAAPLTEARATGEAVPHGEADLLLVTSPRAVQLAGALPRLPVLAVGEASAAAARDRGLEVRAVGHGGLDASLFAGTPPGTRLLHLSGERLAIDPEPMARAIGISYRRVTIYRVAAVAEPPPGLAGFLEADGPHWVTFLSVGAAEAFALLLHRNRSLHRPASLTALCLSGRIEAAAERSGLFATTAAAPVSEPRQFVDFVTSRCT